MKATLKTVRAPKNQPPDAPEAPCPGQPESWFLDNLDLFRSLLMTQARMHRLTLDQTEEFIGWALLRILEGDYAVLRSFRGQCQIRTYLYTVTKNLLRDFRNHLYGKWRPSACALRLGREALWLELLTQRDGFQVEEAVEIIKRNLGSRQSRNALRELAESLPQRIPRRFDSTDDARLLSEDQPLEERLEEPARHQVMLRVQSVLAKALSRLSRLDREILLSLYRDGQTVAQVARRLRLPQRTLYPRRDRCLAALRRSLQQEGLNWSEIAPLLGWSQTHLNLLQDLAS